MPEGPSIVLLKEAVAAFAGKRIIAVHGNAKIDMESLAGQKLLSFNSWGKHLLISFKDFYVRIHLLMFGSYMINAKKDRPERLSLVFKQGEINFYSCSVKLLPGKVEADYDFSADVMNEEWDSSKAKRKLKEIPDRLICDALLDQDIFSGVGNIIKNEVLYRVRIHPESVIKKIPAARISKLIQETRNYSFEFLAWKRNNELKKHWLAHTKKTCTRCDLPLTKKYTGIKKRRSFFCDNCQQLYR